MSKYHSSPLRYPGGKSFLTNFLAETIALNGVEGGTYVEPFAGGAGAALNLLFGEHVASIYLNDIDPCISSFWKAILNETEDFVRLVQDSPIDVTTWRAQREIVKNPQGCSLLEVGFATFFLNRTNRSGVFNGGPIGGLDQKGDYAIDVRFNRKELRRKIERIALYRDRITVSGKDAVDLLKQFGESERWPKNSTIVYLDPPYCDKGKTLYSKFFRDAEHTRLADYLNTCGAFRWLVSYDDTSLVRRLYHGEKNVLFMSYFMHTVRIGRELVIASADCELPPQHFDQIRSGGEAPRAQANG